MVQDHGSCQCGGGDPGLDQAAAGQGSRGRRGNAVHVFAAKALFTRRRVAGTLSDRLNSRPAVRHGFSGIHGAGRFFEGGASDGAEMAGGDPNRCRGIGAGALTAGDFAREGAAR